MITLAAGDEVRAEAGAMTYMTGGIEMDARIAKTSSAISAARSARLGT